MKIKNKIKKGEGRRDERREKEGCDQRREREERKRGNNKENKKGKGIKKEKKYKKNTITKSPLFLNHVFIYNHKIPDQKIILNINLDLNPMRIGFINKKK